MLADVGGVGRKAEKLGMLYVDAGDDFGLELELEPEVNERPVRSSMPTYLLAIVTKSRADGHQLQKQKGRWVYLCN